MVLHQHEIDEEIQRATETIMRFGYEKKACVHRTWYSPNRFSLGFNFKQGVNIGDKYKNDDGSICEVLAIVG